MRFEARYDPVRRPRNNDFAVDQLLLVAFNVRELLELVMTDMMCSRMAVVSGHGRVHKLPVDAAAWD
jgi:hypothetical protein